MAESLAVKYRPSKLDQYIGNTKMISDIKKLLSRSKDDLPQTFMFTGASGCGKTTIARLIAKEYLKDTVSTENLDDYIRTGDDSLIDEITEIDVGQDRGIANMEALKADIVSPSFDDQWKVYIFDEIHASSRASQTSLLKTVEDIPEKVCIIFCTTNPTGVLNTLKGRIQHIYRVEKPSLSELSNALGSICKKEGWEYDTKGVQLLARYAGFQIRDAITALEQVISTHENAKAMSVTDRLDILADTYAERFFKAYKDNDYLAGCDVLADVKKKTTFIEFYNVLREFILQGMYVRNGIQVEGMTVDEMKRFKKLFQALTIDEHKAIMSDLQKLTEHKDDEDDLEVYLLAMTIEGIKTETIPTTVVQVDSNNTESKAEVDKKPNKISYVNTAKLEENHRIKTQRTKTEEKKAVNVHQISRLNEEIKIIDFMDELKGSVYLIKL